MFSMEDKKSIVDDVFGKFHEKFGFYPESTGSYYMDADLSHVLPLLPPHLLHLVLLNIPLHNVRLRHWLVLLPSQQHFHFLH